MEPDQARDAVDCVATLDPDRRAPAITLVGGAAYCSTGGIQAVNRRLVSDLAQAGMLRRAHFLWDDRATASEDARPYVARDCLQLHALNRGALANALAGDALRHRRDHWLCTHINYGPLGMLVSGFRREHLAIMVHAAELDDSLTRNRHRALRFAGLVIAVSDYTRKKAVRLGVDPQRIRVLHNGVDDPCPGGVQRQIPADDTQTVLFVGRMDERYKGQMELLDAMNLLRTRQPRLRLVFVGGGSSLAEWRREAERRMLSDVVTFTGRVSDAELARHYATATVFAMPSENEGFGLVYAEAMAHGLPCIGSDRDAAREVIADGETGLCVPAGNSTALADAITTIVRSPELCATMGRLGRERFEQHFTGEAYRARLLALMEEWLRSKGEN